MRLFILIFIHFFIFISGLPTTIKAQRLVNFQLNNRKSFDSIVNNQINNLVYFYADWCITCKTMNAKIEKIHKQFKNKINIIEINIDNNPSLISSLQIPAVPAFHHYKNGEIEWAFLGYLSYPKLKKAIHLSQ
ncbi:MAG: thioredoxin [Chitinophagaceae bacterium]|nr:MAG: thioredoxin [Chitinophagaceae bacterium]